MRLKLHRFEFTFPRPALVMGIVNVTPDSFSDGGRFLDPQAAVDHALKLVEDGADILDIGGESTRPRAVPVEEEEEIRRVMPVIEALAGRVNIPLSIDTMKPGVARLALGAGASLVNDVGANRAEAAMWELVADSGAGYVCMHMQGTPATMQEAPRYENVVAEVKSFFSDRMRQLKNCGVDPDQLILDPGIGFGKTAEHNLTLIAALQLFVKLERPVLLGVSRKSFLGKWSGADAASRLPAGLACTCLAAESGVQIFRTHDVAETVQVLRMTEEIANCRKTQMQCGT